MVNLDSLGIHVAGYVVKFGKPEVAVCRILNQAAFRCDTVPAVQNEQALVIARQEERALLWVRFRSKVHTRHAADATPEIRPAGALAHVRPIRNGSPAFALDSSIRHDLFLSRWQMLQALSDAVQDGPILVILCPHPAQGFRVVLPPQAVRFLRAWLTESFRGSRPRIRAVK